MKIKNIILATRPWSFPASVMPVLIGAAYAFYLQKENGLLILWWLFPLILIAAVTFHAAGNIISDYHDAKNGVDKLESYGDTNLMLTGTFSGKTFLMMGLSWLATAIVLGVIIMFYSSWQLIYFGLFGIACTLSYYKMKYRGLGDVIILFSFGICIVNGTVYALTDMLNIQSFCISLPVALLTTAILHANNTRDMPLDKESGIKTLSMILGMEKAKNYYYLLVCATYVIEIILILIGYVPAWSILTLLSLPLVLKNFNQLHKVTSDSLESIAHLDVNTAQLTTLFAILSVIGFIIGAI